MVDSESGMLSKLELEFPFKPEHMLKIMKTFLAFLKNQEERQKFSLQEVERQFEKKLDTYQNKISELVNKENQAKIERVIQFDEKLHRMNAIEQQTRLKMMRL